MGTAPTRPQFNAQMSGARGEAARDLPDAPAVHRDRDLPPLTDLAGGAAFVVDLSLRCLVAEGDAIRLAGLSPEALIGRPIAEVVDPLLASRLEPHSRLALDGHPFACEHDVRGRAYLSRGLPLRDPAGRIYAALVVTYDITDQRQAEALKRRSEETFATLIEHAPFGLFVVDAGFRLRATNHGADALFRNLEPALGRDFGDLARALWPASQAVRVIGEFRHTLATGEAYVAPRDHAHAGPMAAYDWQLQRITLPDGTLGVACYAYDLTPVREAERVVTQAEARLRDSEARLTLALDASGMGTFVWHVDEARGEPDARTLALLGLTDPAPSLADALDTLVHPDDRPRYTAAVARALDPAGTGALQEDVRIRRPDGAERWLGLTARTTFEGEPRRPVRIAGVVADIDARKRTEASLRERDQQLTDADRRKDEFLAMLAHELRNPLAPIRAGLELIRLGGDTVAAVERTRAIMERQVGHMVRLIDDLLDVSRITSGKIHLQRRPTPIETLVNTAIEANREAIAAAHLDLLVELPAEAIDVHADPTRGVQVISNVLHNAVKFTDAGGRIRVTAALEPDPGGGAATMVALTIADTGVGISPEMLPRVFDLFTQDRAAATRSHAGLGIGLALARRLVEMHGGTIDARSDGHGRGSTFTLRLPIATAAVDVPPLERRGVAPRVRHRVVVIDDNLDAGHAMAMLIGALGSEARVAADGPSGIEQVLQWSPTLVLLDIGMPGMDGYETCRRIREAVGPSLRVVALTGWGQDQDKRDARQAGFDAHLTKPADPAALEQLLGDTLPPG
jgi:PAS domain S-box-containing protein